MTPEEWDAVGVGQRLYSSIPYWSVDELFPDKRVEVLERTRKTLTVRTLHPGAEPVLLRRAVAIDEWQVSVARAQEEQVKVVERRSRRLWENLKGLRRYRQELQEARDRAKFTGGE